MSSPDCKRQKLADDVNSVAKMSNVSPKKECGTQTGNVTITASASNKASVINENFEDVASLDEFVDRTMLIEELLDHKSNYVMIFAPSKFGKTMNLNMIRFFCDIEDKHTKTKEDVTKDPTMQELRSNPSKNMKVLLRQFKDKQYEECLILKQEEFVIQHFGRHPVILFNFKDCRPVNESQAIVTCAKQLRTAYLENDYLENSKEFQSDNPRHVLLKQTCKKWCSYDDDQLEKLYEGRVIHGLEDLIKSLRIHWGRHPVFLVDEIDKPYVAAMENELSEREVNNIGSCISDVVCSILKSGDKKLKLQAALLTGISKFIHCRTAPSENIMSVYFLDDARFSKYYGLTAKEVDSLVRKFCVSEGDAEITTIISNINAYYNGYYQRSFIGEKPLEYARYCLFSVLSYIKEINKNKNDSNFSFWDDGGLMGKLVSVLKKSDDIMGAVQTLLYSDSGTIAITYQQQVYVEHLLGIYRKEMVPDPDATFNFFLQRGFLAHNLEKPEEMDEFVGLKIYLKIPNLEIKHMYHEMFACYHASLPETIKSKFTSCGEFFKSLPTELESPTQNSAEFAENLDKLCEDLKCIFSFMNCQSEASVCSHILTILKLDAGYEKGELDYTVQYLDNGKQCCVCIDVWGYHGNFALIFEVKYNGEKSKKRSSLAAAEDIVTLLPGKKYPEDTLCRKAGTGRDLGALESSQIENYLLVGLAVDGDGTTHMLVFRNNTDWKNVIQVNPENHVAELISTHLKSN